MHYCTNMPVNNKETGTFPLSRADFHFQAHTCLFMAISSICIPVTHLLSTPALCTHTHTHTHTHTRTRTQTHTYTQTHTRTHKHTHAHTNKQTHEHKHTQTRTTHTHTLRTHTCTQGRWAPSLRRGQWPTGARSCSPQI